MSAPPESLQQQQSNGTTAHKSGSVSSATSSSPVLTSSNAIAADPLTCQWAQCRERCTSPETLYDHVCERHVGRKSTNNLNLQCQWGNCRTTTVKRDHITSHIRVHVPLKPHKCEFCGKSFKRPQDLKKHVKTHADESVILRSPEPTVSSQKPSNIASAYQHVSSKASGYYPDSHHPHMSTGSYGYPTAAATHSHYGAAVTAPSYGPVYYNIPQAQSFAQSGMVESRKRGIDDLNDFFGNVKRRQVNASEYQDLGARFSNLLAAGVPMNSFEAGYNAGLRAANGSMSVDNMATSASYQNPMVPSMGGGQFSLPFNELKTKSDLMTIDHFLEQLQQTVYENPDQVAAAGVQPMSQVHHVGMPFRSNNSPPHFGHNSSISSAGATPEAFSTASFGGSAASVFDDAVSTPALTPASYAAASHSPASSQTNMSPLPRPANTATASLYPSLPSFSTLTDAHGVPQNTSGSAAPFSNLGSAYDDYDTRRRYSGGFLQRIAPSRSGLTVSSQHAARTSPSDSSVSSPDTATPSVGGSPSSRRSSMELTKPFRNVGLSSPKMASGRVSPASGVKLPGVADITRGNIGERERTRDKEQSQESWVKNMRVIEELLRYVRGRLDRGDFVDEAGNGSDDASQDRKEQQQRAGAPPSHGESLYPSLRPVEAAS